MGAGVVVAWIVVVAVINRGAPVVGRFALDQRQQAVALHVVGNGDPGGFEEGLGVIEIERDGIGGAAGSR